jgi:hypothetical protein
MDGCSVTDLHPFQQLSRECKYTPKYVQVTPLSCHDAARLSSTLSVSIPRNKYYNNYHWHLHFATLVFTCTNTFIGHVHLNCVCLDIKGNKYTEVFFLLNDGTGNNFKRLPIWPRSRTINCVHTFRSFANSLKF